MTAKKTATASPTSQPGDEPVDEASIEKTADEPAVDEQLEPPVENPADFQQVVLEHPNGDVITVPASLKTFAAGLGYEEPSQPSTSEEA